MDINEIVCPASIEDNLIGKHNISLEEVHEVLWSVPRVRFAERGFVDGEDIYVAFGQTYEGRFVSVFFVYKPSTGTAIVISARDMSAKERRSYGRK